MRSAGYFSKTKTSFALLTSDRLLLCSCAAWYFAARSSASCLERESAVQVPRTGAPRTAVPLGKIGLAYSGAEIEPVLCLRAGQEVLLR